MKFSALALFLSFWLVSPELPAQEHQVLIDMAPAFISSPTIHFQYRKLKDDRAFRLSVNLSHDDSHNESETQVVASGSSNSRSTSDITSWQWGIRPGLQVSKEFERFFTYYGADLMVNQLYTYSESEEKVGGGVGVPRTTINSREQEWQYGIVPLLGIGKIFNIHFTAMVEINMGFYRSNKSNSSEKSYYFKDPQGVESLNNTDNLVTRSSGYHIGNAPKDFFRLYLGYLF